MDHQTRGDDILRMGYIRQKKAGDDFNILGTLSKCPSEYEVRQRCKVFDGKIPRDSYNMYASSATAVCSTGKDERL